MQGILVKKVLTYFENMLGLPFFSKINDDPMLILTYLRPRSNLILNAFKWEMFK